MTLKDLLTQEGLDLIGSAIYDKTPVTDQVSDMDRETRMVYYMKKIMDNPFVRFDPYTDEESMNYVLENIMQKHGDTIY